MIGQNPHTNFTSVRSLRHHRLRARPTRCLCRILDVARLAVQAILHVDLQALAALGVVKKELVDARWTIARLGACVLNEIDG